MACSLSAALKPGTNILIKNGAKIKTIAITKVPHNNIRLMTTFKPWKPNFGLISDLSKSLQEYDKGEILTIARLVFGELQPNWV